MCRQLLTVILIVIIVHRALVLVLVLPARCPLTGREHGGDNNALFPPPGDDGALCRQLLAVILVSIIICVFPTLLRTLQEGACVK